MAHKIDTRDKQLLYELDKDAGLPETTLAKKIGRSKESVRYRIKSLTDAKVLHGFSIWIDPTKLGYSSYKIYLTLANIPDQRSRFIEHVKKDERLFWLGVAEGAWNAGLTYFCKSNAEFFELKNDLFSKFRDLILDSHTAVLVEVLTGPKKFLRSGSSEWTSMFSQTDQLKLDDTDKHILRCLFKDGRTSVVSMARTGNVSVDMIRTRVARLEEKKVISRYVPRIDYQVLGFEFYKTFVYFRNLTRSDESRLQEYARQQPNIINFIRQISPWDVELEIMCKGYSEYNAIVRQFTNEFSGVVSKIETAIMSEDYVFPAGTLIID